ncbi:MAG TPA: hypothetical protein VGH63_13690 [Polyangia bacterium]|jgi:hypothetical protein
MFEKKAKTTKKVKLELNRETLRKLSNAELGQARGAARPESEGNCQSERRGNGNESWPQCVPIGEG